MLYKKAPPKREVIAVNEVIGEMVMLLRGEASRCAVSIRTDSTADVPQVMADHVQLQQVLMNLMLNGIEAMKELGGVLGVESGLGQNGEVLISVADTASGCLWGRATRYLMLSLRQSQTAAEWAWRFAVRSSSHMAAGYGPQLTRGVARHFISLCQRRSRNRH
jgi:hypothetical protein